MSAGGRLAALAEELRRDTSAGDKILRVAQRGTLSFGLAPWIVIGRCIIVDLTRPPPVLRAFRDLVVRRGNEGDVAGMSSVSGGSPALMRARLDRGDLCYVGALDDEIICLTWFHRGPARFDEDRPTFASWALEPTTYWSYDAVAREDARSSGVFVKMFQIALGEVLGIHGGERVQGFIHHTNDASITVHDKLGFSVLGTLTSLAAGGWKWLRWDGGSTKRTWFVRRDDDLAIGFPPV